MYFGKELILYDKLFFSTPAADASLEFLALSDHARAECCGLWSPHNLIFHDLPVTAHSGLWWHFNRNDGQYGEYGDDDNRYHH